MVRRLESESKLPGMQCTRRCSNCGAPLPIDGNERCDDCQPILSDEARAVGEARRREREQIEEVERQFENVSRLINKIYRSLK